MAQFRVVEIGTYWIEYEVDAKNHDDAETRVRQGEGTETRRGSGVDQYETEDLTVKSPVEG